MKSSRWIPFLFIFAILALVLIIVLRDDKSLISKFAQMISRNIEGFASPPVLDTPRCPTGGYNFFADRLGQSFCCRGKINPYTHTCEAQGGDDLCAFSPNINDPRNKHRILPLCSNMIVNNHNTQQSSCPDTLSNYASIDKCCANNPDLDGFDCVREDNADFKKYCKLNGPLKPGEQLCSTVGMIQQASMSCPPQIPQGVMYITGEKEKAAYGPAAAGLPVPTCFGMNSVCIPDLVIDYYQKNKGLYKDKDIPKWAYSCSGWNTVNVNKDLTIDMDTSYV